MDKSIDVTSATFTGPTQAASFPSVFNNLTWAAATCNVISIVLAVYLLVFKLRLSLSRWQKGDTHYRLRVVLCAFLLLNRVSQIIRQFTRLKLDTFRGVKRAYDLYGYDFITSLQLVHESFHTIWLCTLYIILTLILWITLDRYTRLAMVLPNSKLGLFFKWTRVMTFIGTLYVTAGYIAINSTYLVRDRRTRDSSLFKSYIVSRQFLELGFLSFGIPTEYFFTCKLVWCSMKSTLHTGPLNEHVAGTRTMTRLEIIRKQKLRIAMKIVFLFLSMFLVDAAISATFIVLQGLPINLNISYPDWDQMMILMGSWAVVRIWCTFELLDIFLIQLRKANSVRIPIEKSASTHTPISAESRLWTFQSSHPTDILADGKKNLSIKTTERESHSIFSYFVDKESDLEYPSHPFTTQG